jgi:hypothetical protein
MNVPLAPDAGLLSVMACMAEDLRFVDVAQRQGDDVIRWTSRIEVALAAAAEVEGASAGLTCRFYGSQTHRTWLLTSYSVIGALQDQVDQAAYIEREARAAAAAAGAAAAAAESAASDAYAAAADAEPGSSAEAQALGEAAAAEAEAATAHAAQAAAEARAAAAARWGEAAADACQFGKDFTAREDAIHRPHGEVIASVGGIRETAQNKRYHQEGRAR